MNRKLALTRRKGGTLTLENEKNLMYRAIQAWANCSSGSNTCCTGAGNENNQRTEPLKQGNATPSMSVAFCPRAHLRVLCAELDKAEALEHWLDGAWVMEEFQMVWEGQADIEG